MKALTFAKVFSCTSKETDFSVKTNSASARPSIENGVSEFVIGFGGTNFSQNKDITDVNMTALYAAAKRAAVAFSVPSDSI